MKSNFIFGKNNQQLFNLAKEKKFALPAVNVSGTNTINSVLETASEVNSPVIIQFSNGGSQFIAGKGSTQEEFFHTFNALVDQNKQIIISGDRAPGEIKDLEDRIKSRLQSGLVVDLHPTDYELRLGILQSKVERQKQQYPELSIDSNVLEFLALRISTNVRVLEGALTRLFAFASLIGRHITLDVAQDCLADVLRASERKITVEEIQRKVSEHYNIRLSDMIGPKRLRTYARPRQIAMFLSKQLTSRSLPEIGRRFGGRDHTTVMHGVRRIEELRAQDGQIAEDLEMLRRALEA